MSKNSSEITVLFENPFWVCIYTRQQGDSFTACRVVLGAEPSDAQMYQLLLERWPLLRFGPVVDAKQARAVRNPKRRQREAKKATQSTGTGTKAQQALAAAREAGKQAAKSQKKETRQREQQRRFALRRHKRKQKRRGH